MPTKAKPAKNWRQIFTPPIIVCLAGCAFCLVMAIICLLNPGTKQISTISPVENMQPLDILKGGTKLTQTFTPDTDYASFGFYYANFGNYLQNGDLYVTIENPQKEASEFVYRISGLADNNFLYIDYALKGGETYTASIRISDEAEGITFFATTAENYGANFTLNKTAKPFSIIMALNQEVQDRFSAWYYIFALSLILCYLVLKLDRSVYVK